MTPRAIAAFIIITLSSCATKPKGEEDFIVPWQIADCKDKYTKALNQVEECKRKCDYGSHCCTIFQCDTGRIETWNGAADGCAEWSVALPAILWPKANTGQHWPECDAPTDDAKEEAK
jgi:hypothetical protein